jgi:hypothetical protein
MTISTRNSGASRVRDGPADRRRAGSRHCPPRDAANVWQRRAGSRTLLREEPLDVARRAPARRPLCRAHPQSQSRLFRTTTVATLAIALALVTSSLRLSMPTSSAHSLFPIPIASTSPRGNRETTAAPPSHSASIRTSASAAICSTASSRTDSRCCQLPAARYMARSSLTTTGC